MCGIVGHISFVKQPLEDQVESLVQRIRHRGPDDCGLWTSANKVCVFGHARLSIIDLSPLGHQPMVDPETGNCIVFNGEIYNFQALRQECEAAGDKFRSFSDTEVILAIYRRHGIACLDKLRGMFAFAIWDEQNQRAFLARDRIGKKPLNYMLVDGQILFCSEIEPLSRHPLVSREMDVEALELYLQLQYIPAPRTIYRAIRKLPPAHYAVFDRDGFNVKQYWRVDYTEKVEINEQDALDGLEEKLTEAVRLRMVADVPLGGLLSGGVDSSVVVALMAKVAGTSVRTFSVGFKEGIYNELPFARQAAEICNTKHYPQIVEGDVEHLLPLLARHYGEPFADSSALPSFIVSKVARDHVTVAMNGDGGDELMGGYPWHLLSSYQMKFSPYLAHLIPARFAAQTAPKLRSVRSGQMKLFRKLLMDYIHPELRAVVNMYSAFFNDDERPALLPSQSNKALLSDWRSSWFVMACRYADNPVERMLWYDNYTYLPDDLLVKMDIASMHCGLETRSPLLDQEVIEYCAALPVQLKVKNGTGKYLLKKLAERYFPTPFVYRTKMGFGIPLAEWLRGSLRKILEDTLRDEALMAPLVHSTIERYLNEFLHHDVNHSKRLWALLMFGMWRQHYLSAA